MAFVKLDCGMLDSTLWVDREAREMMITALLMAVPREIKEPTPAIQVRTLQPLDFVVQPGWYGFVQAAGTGISRRAGIAVEDGLAALERLAGCDPESRTPDHEGRRMVRVDGGFVILNYDKYRRKDYTAADRVRRYRERKSYGATVTLRVTDRNVTQAEAEEEEETPLIPPCGVSEPAGSLPPDDPAARKGLDDSPPKARKPRPRDLVLDALAEHAEASDPTAIPPKRWATIAVAGAQIRKASPTVTPPEIAARAENYRTHFPDATLTAPALATHWARCAKPKIANCSRPVQLEARL